MSAMDEKKKKAYWPLVEWLIGEDKPSVFIADIPKNVGGDKLLPNLQAAWIDGLIEFGRRCYVTTGVPSANSKKEHERVVLESEMSWTGHKKHTHRPLKDILEEDKALPKNVVEIDNVQGKDGNYSAQAVPVDAGILRLQMRATDKCYAELAA